GWRGRGVVDRPWHGRSAVPRWRRVALGAYQRSRAAAPRLAGAELGEHGGDDDHNAGAHQHQAGAVLVRCAEAVPDGAVAREHGRAAGGLTAGRWWRGFVTW